MKKAIYAPAPAATPRYSLLIAVSRNSYGGSAETWSGGECGRRRLKRKDCASARGRYASGGYLGYSYAGRNNLVRGYPVGRYLGRGNLRDSGSCNLGLGLNCPLGGALADQGLFLDRHFFAPGAICFF